MPLNLDVSKYVRTLERRCVVFSRTVTVCLLIASAAAGWEHTPEIHADIMLDYLVFSGDSVYSAQGYLIEESDRFRIRKAAVSLHGRAGEIITYEAEAAMASCAGGTGLSIMEAGVFLEPEGSPVRLGMGQLHAMRGFSMGEECGHSLLLEKPVWSKTLSPACHSLGALAEFELPCGLSGQAGIYNGPSGSLEDDWDAVGWLAWNTPVDGLRLGGFVERTHLEMNPQSEGPEEADRYGIGVDMDNGSLFGRVEYSAMSGVPMMSLPQSCEEIASQVENTGLLIQAGYGFGPVSEFITGVRPYAGYQIWNRWSNAEAGDWDFGWLEAGVQVNLDAGSWLTLGWSEPVQAPEGSPEESSLIVVRLATEI